MSSSRIVFDAAAFLLGIAGLVVAFLLLWTDADVSEALAEPEVEAPEAQAEIITAEQNTAAVDDGFDTLELTPPAPAPGLVPRIDTVPAPTVPAPTIAATPGSANVILGESGATVAGRSQVAIRSGDVDTWPEQQRQFDARTSNWGPEPAFPTITVPSFGQVGSIDTWEDTDSRSVVRESNWGPEPSIPTISIPEFSATRQEIDTWPDREPAPRSESDWGVEQPIPTPTTIRIEVIRGEVDTWPADNGLERDVTRAAVDAIPAADVVSTRIVTTAPPVTVARAAATTTVPPTTTAPPTTTTTAPPTTTTTSAPPAEVRSSALSLGSSGPAVEALQQRLADLGYQPGIVDGEFGFSTQSAVWAYQKVNGLVPDGIVGPQVSALLERIDQTLPSSIGSAADRVDVDIDNQLLVIYEGGAPSVISHVSSGNGENYCEQGRCGVADTPEGDFTYQRSIDGWRTSYLGRLYNPMYFTGGYAIHGSTSVPLEPASHGCVRVPMHVAETLPDIIDYGTPINIA